MGNYRVDRREVNGSHYPQRGFLTCDYDRWKDVPNPEGGLGGIRCFVKDRAAMDQERNHSRSSDRAAGAPHDRLLPQGLLKEGES